jgi:membrane protein YqaA with SNARE-associated domain
MNLQRWFNYNKHDEYKNEPKWFSTIIIVILVIIGLYLLPEILTKYKPY